MPIQTIDRGTAGNTGDTFKVGVAFDTCQANDEYLDSVKAPLSSPAFTDTPTAPTAAANTNTMQLANTAFVQGELADRVQVVETFADLATTAATTAGMIVYIKQHTSGGLGGGHFQDMSGAVTNDGGTIINNTITGGRHWRRVVDYYATPQMFGALGDGSADDTAAIQAALNYITSTTFATTWVLGVPAYTKGGGTILFPSGVYRITDTLKVGQHIRMLGISTSGFFYPYLNTKGACIYADFSGNKWVIDTANFTSAGVAVGYRDSITGVQLDAGTYNSCHGVQIENLVIYTNSSLYGGIRLNGAPNSNISNCGVYGTDINYFVASSWGATLSNIKGVFYLYGCFAAPDCNSLKISGYLDGAGSKTIDDTNRPTQIFKDDFDVANGFPSALYNKRTGFLCYYNNAVIADGLTTEHADFGRIIVRTPGYTDTSAYVEACNNGYYAIATSSGTITSMFQYNPSITTGWVFGQAANFALNDCPASGVLADATCNVKIVSADPEADGWKYLDALTYIGAKIGVIRVSASGSASNFANATNYTTIDEALRRISISAQREWSIVIKDGDTVSVGSVVSLSGKFIKFVKEGGGAAPKIIFVVTSGYPAYIALDGNCELCFDGVNVGYTAATTPADTTLSSGIFLQQDKATNLTLSFNLSTVDLQTAWSLIQQGFNSSNSIISSFSVCAITGSGTARIHATAFAATGVTNVINRQIGCTVSASIKAIGTNGWENSNVISSNF